MYALLICNCDSSQCSNKRYYTDYRLCSRREYDFAVLWDFFPGVSRNGRNANEHLESFEPRRNDSRRQLSLLPSQIPRVSEPTRKGHQGSTQAHHIQHSQCKAFPQGKHVNSSLLSLDCAFVCVVCVFSSPGAYSVRGSRGIVSVPFQFLKL